LRRRRLRHRGEGSSRRERRWLKTVIASAAEQSILPLRGESLPFRHCRARPGNPSSSKMVLRSLMDARVKPGHDECRHLDSKHTFTPSRRHAPEALLYLPPKEGVGNAGCPLHPRPRVHLVLVERTRVTTSTPESPDVPARNGLTAYNALSPEYRAFLPPSPSGYGTSAPGRADMPPKDLTPTTEASGPHDFAVRNNIVRQRAV
jgi:hypothetical protein